MRDYEIKFQFNCELLDKDDLDLIFDNLDNLLNSRFDENFNIYNQKNEVTYSFEDVSNQSSEFIKNKITIFFSFSFDEIIDVCLYRFLVLKNKEKLTIFANIHSSIFDYSSINHVYKLFNSVNENDIKNRLSEYYDDFNEYLNSPYFDDDCVYWRNALFDIENHIKYYRIATPTYRSRKVVIKNDYFNSFLKNHNVSKLDFIIALVLLYQYHAEGTYCALLKTNIPNNEGNFGSYDKNTLLKIDYIEDDTFEEFLSRINVIYEDACKHTKVDIENYIDTDYYYCFHDFTNLDKVKVKNSDKSAFTINIYEDSVELIYNYELFSEIYIEFALKNIKYLFNSVLENPTQKCSDLRHLSIGNEYKFTGLCPLSNSQKIIYLDEMRGKRDTKNNNPIKINLGKDYSVDKVKNSLNKLFELHPIFKSRILENEYIFDFNANPPILVGTVDDVDSFVRPFNLQDYLARFLIVVDDELYLCMDCHSLIFDSNSYDTSIKTLFKILNETHWDIIDKGILRQSAFEKVIEGSQYSENAKKFFDNLLADRDEVYDLSFSVEDYSSKTYRDNIFIDKQAFNLFLKNHKINRRQFFTSVFAYTLSRFTGSPKVLFNLITDGRNHLGLSDAVGMFFKISPVIMDCKNQPVDSFIKYSKRLIDSIMKYDLYSLLEMAFDYDLNNNIFFYYLQDISHIPRNLTFEFLDKDISSNFSFIVYYVGESNYQVRLLYSTEYSDRFITHFVDSFKMIISEIFEAITLSEINYISNHDLKLLDDYNQNEHDLKYDDILEAFNDNLSRNPDSKLVSYGDKSYTHAECAFIADRLANSLKDMGINPQDKVAFFVERSELYMFCTLGILSAGAVFVPLDTTHPNERIRFILNDTAPKVVIISDKTYDQAKSFINNLKILNISDILNEGIGTASSLPVSYGKVASILYTSGTTGLPKGVKITRRAILNITAYYEDAYGISGSDVWGLYSTIGFNSASQAICQSIYSGSCVSIVPDEFKSDIFTLNEYFIKQGVTHTMLTTQMAKQFIENIDETLLKVLIAGGEKLGKFKTSVDYIVLDALGLTEAFALVSSIHNSEKLDASSVGRLNYNTKAYILDEECRRVPIGAVGELCLSGYQISDGYLNREEENSRTFIENPFEDNEDYGVLCRTGDMVRILPDGTLGFEGRRDNQVKINGLRLDLSEVEVVIREIEYVEDASVQLIKYKGVNELVAYVVVNSYSGDDFNEDIKQYIASKKPEFMIPAFIVKLENIPLNINGKVDKRALPRVREDETKLDYVAPTTAVEKYIVHAFEVSFNQNNISLFDDFIRLGGDSLTAFEIISILSNYDIDIGVDVIFNNKTPYKIAKFIKLF